LAVSAESLARRTSAGSGHQWLASNDLVDPRTIATSSSTTPPWSVPRRRRGHRNGLRVDGPRSREAEKIRFVPWGELASDGARVEGLFTDRRTRQDIEARREERSSFRTRDDPDVTVALGVQLRRTRTTEHITLISKNAAEQRLMTAPLPRSCKGRPRHRWDQARADGRPSTRTTADQRLQRPSAPIPSARPPRAAAINLIPASRGRRRRSARYPELMRKLAGFAVA